MPQQCNFRQLNEKQAVAEVDLMLWSPKMDLIAFSTTQGEVYMYRLSWQKVWFVANIGIDIKLTTLAWRPDGKILAVGYSNGVINLHDVENSECVHTLRVSGSPTAMQWMVTLQSGDSQSGECYADNSSKYLPRLLSLSKNYGSLSKTTEENVEDSKRLNDVTQLSFLVVGTSVGEISLFALGIFHCSTIDLASSHPDVCGKILSVQLSDDLNVLLVIASSEPNSSDKDGGQHNINLLTYKTPVLHFRQKEILALGLKYSKILALMDYLSFTVKAIGEAWEDVLLEIDDKLLKFSEEKQKLGEDGGTVSDDFLELLMFGVPSPELENFLLHTMTEKGLKKLGHSIEMSYSNIQKLVLKHLQSVGHALVYHLSQLKGMTLWKERFGDFGLGPETLEQALASAGSFVMKALEIQQVIDHSMRNFKAVFRWLYAVILRLSDEQVPSEITRVTQQDLYFVAKFLRDNFTGNEAGEGSASSSENNQKKGFSLERVGQYLKPEPLSIQENTMQNPWVQFLKSHPNLDSSTGLIFQHDPKASLVQQHQALESILNETFSRPAQALTDSLKIDSITKLHFKCDADQIPLQVSDHLLKFTQIPVLKETSPVSVLVLGQFVQLQNTRNGIVNLPSQDCYLYGISHNLQEWSNITHGLRMICKIPLNNTGAEKIYNFLDIQFYNEDTISILLVEKSEQNKPPLLVQLPTSFLESQLRQSRSSSDEVFNIGDILESLSYRSLENLKARSLAVSGSRKVACVLFASRRRVRLFEMDVDDEEEDDGTDRGEADTSDGNVSRKGPTPMQVSSQETEDENKENSSET